MVGDGDLPVGPGEGEGAAGAARGEGDGERLTIRASKHRDMQVAAEPKRKLFKGKRRKVFFEWLAATGNCAFSAAKAGVCHQTVWKHRMKDPRFAADFD